MIIKRISAIISAELFICTAFEWFVALKTISSFSFGCHADWYWLEKEGTKFFYMYNHLQTVIYNYKRLKTE